ncbi:hypothetical protein COO91_00415 [Nostoc flagelliforme CCNUN1]|uniref:Uncharacterized protein n=1 Tax=Nostoc flagelliforme CCNUN1 TaxID=2038116 RepID=A0A2K8SGM3_9NOSO|nr:hypothetical protein COO91_00415 [Nostoc flagelliforme CCNUN1]
MVISHWSLVSNYYSLPAPPAPPAPPALPASPTPYSQLPLTPDSTR